MPSFELPESVVGDVRVIYIGDRIIAQVKMPVAYTGGTQWVDLNGFKEWKLIPVSIHEVDPSDA